MANVIEFTLKTDDQASKKFKGLTDSVAKTAKTVAKFTAVAVAGATATVAFTKAVADAQDKAGKFAFRIGKSVEKLTAYQHAANLSGISSETFNMALQRMERRAGEAAQGTGEALSALRDLGIEAKSFANLPLDDQLGLLADKFGDMTDSSEVMTKAFKLFDSEGVAMLQLLKQGSPAMRKMAEEAKMLGLVVSEKAAANSAAFNDSLTKLWGSITGTSRSIANELMPMLTGLAESLTEFVVANRERVLNFFKGFISGFITMGIVAKTAFENIGIAIREVFSEKGFDNFVAGFKQAVSWIINAAPNFVVGYGKVLIAGFRVIWEGFVTAGKWAWDSVKAIFGGAQTISLGELLFSELDKATAKARDDFSFTFSEFKAIAIRDGKEVATALNGIVGVNLDAAQTQAAELVNTLSVFGEVTEASRNDEVGKTATFLETLGGMYGEYISKQKSATEQLAVATQQIFISATQGIGDAVGQAVVQQQNLMGLLKSVGEQVLQSLISMMVQVGIQRVALGAIQSSATSKQSAGDIAAASAKTYANTFATTTAIPGGIFLAPGVAAGAVATMLAGATASGASGGAVGAAIPAFHGGIDYVPSEQTALVNKGERIVSPNQNRDLTSFLDSGGGGGGGGGVIIENINILPNATSAQALLDMPPLEMRRIVEEKIIAALDELDGIGIRQDRLNKVV